MIELSKDMKKWIRTIPLNILHDLWSITQDIPYIYEDEHIKWREIDAFAQEISYAHREGNNPD